MQATGSLRRHRGRLRYLRRVGRQGAHRAWPPRAPARTRQEHRARQGLHGGSQGAVGLPASRRPDARAGRRLPGAQARLPAQREAARLVGQREGIAVYRGQALRLVSRLPGGRPLADLGPPELSPRRPRFRGQRERGHRRRLADPLRRHRAVVRPRRAPRRHQRIGRRPAAAARRPVPAADAAQRRRADAVRPTGQAVRGHAADHLRAGRQPDPAARQARTLPVPQRLPVRLPVRRRISARSRRRCRRRWRPAG